MSNAYQNRCRVQGFKLSSFGLLHSSSSRPRLSPLPDSANLRICFRLHVKPYLPIYFRDVCYSVGGQLRCTGCFELTQGSEIVPSCVNSLFQELETRCWYIDIFTSSLSPLLLLIVTAIIKSWEIRWHKNITPSFL